MKNNKNKRLINKLISLRKKPARLNLKLNPHKILLTRLEMKLSMQLKKLTKPKKKQKRSKRTHRGKRKPRSKKKKSSKRLPKN